MLDTTSYANLPPRSWRTVAAYQQWAMHYFVSRGLTPVQAAAIVGNITQESAMDPDAIRPNDAGPGIDSRGLCQWNRARLANLTIFNPNALNRAVTTQERFAVQLAFVMHELFTTHLPARHQLIFGDQDDMLAGTFGKLYEGFGDASVPMRDSYARIVLQQYDPNQQWT